MDPSAPRDPLVSIIIPVYNLWDYTLRCLMSVLKHTAHIPHEVIVVDDASTDETREGLPMLEGIRLLRNEVNQGFARNNNLAARVARGKHLVFLNNDTEVLPRWLDELLAVVERHEKVGMVGSKLLFPDGTIQHAGVAFSYGAPDPITPIHIHYQQPASVSQQSYELNAVTAACALMPRELFLSLGGFDEGFRMGYEDVDLCLRVRAAGWKIVYTHQSQVIHYESLSPGRFVASRRNVERLHTKWWGRIPLFESDYRTAAAPTRHRAPRAPCSLIVSVHDDLSTIAPCLHNLLFDLGPEDEVIVVDDGSVGATAAFVQSLAASQAPRCQLVRLEASTGLASAWLAGVQRARHELVVTLLCTQRVIPGWLDRLVQHLEARNDVVLGVRAADGGKLLRAPLSCTQGGPPLPPARVPGDVRVSRWSVGGVFAGGRARLRGLLEAHPEGVPGGDPGAWPRALEASGARFCVAEDVNPYSMHQIFPFSDDHALDIYSERVSAAARGSSNERVSIVIVVREGGDPLTDTLAALERNASAALDLVVVADGVSEPARAALERTLSAARGGRGATCEIIWNPVRAGYPVAINQGLAASHGSFVVVMNEDVVVTPRWLDRMLAVMQVNPSVGIVGPVSDVGPRPQRCEVPNALEPPMPLDAFAADWATKTAAEFGSLPRVSGICMLIRRTVIDTVGGFDPAYGDEEGDVEDFCLRATRAGFVVALAREAYVAHGGRSSPRWLDLHPRRNPPAGWLRFCQRWNHAPAWADTEGLSKVFTPHPPFDPTTDHVPLAPAVRLAGAVTSMTQPRF